MKRKLLIVALAAAVMPLAYAADAGKSDLERLTGELQELLDKGERERLADPWYLRDLRGVVAKYRDPWRKKIFDDEFSGRNPDPGKPWAVVAGEFRVDWRHGLRSVVSPAQDKPADTPGEQPRQRERKGEDLARELVGSILGQALGTAEKREAEKPAQKEPKRDARRALALAEVPITNAFELEVEMSVRPMEGQGDERFELGVYQDRSRLAGYRLVLSPGAKGRLSLVSVSARGGTSVIDLHEGPLEVADGKSHTLRWTRDPAGNMDVQLDEKPLIRIADRRFGDPFDGMLVLNEGGDYALRKVTIEGAE